MEFDNALLAIAQKAKMASPQEEGDYTGADGLLYCHKCNTPKQTRITLTLEGREGERTVPCLCKCRTEQRDREEAERKQREREIQIRKNRHAAFPESEFENWNFDADDKSNPKLTQVMKNYVEHFPELYKQGKGLLLYGPVGRGKTFMAACAANALINKGYTVLMTNFARIANTTSGMYEGKQAYFDSLNRYDVLILDDLAAERKTEFMQEIVFSVIDARYRAGKPLIITTNLSMEELKKPSELSHQRIFDRVLEMTVPIEVLGVNKRYKKINEDYAKLQGLLGL